MVSSLNELLLYIILGFFLSSSDSLFAKTLGFILSADLDFINSTFPPKVVSRLSFPLAGLLFETKGLISFFVLAIVWGAYESFFCSD